MLHQNNITNCSGSESSQVNRKIVRFNGYPAIEHLTLRDCHHDFFYSEENRLLVIIDGAIDLNSGKLVYEVNKNQMAFLKNNTLVEYQHTGHLGKRNKTELAIFYLNHELIKEFSKATQLTSCSGIAINGITISDLHPSLKKFMDSLTAYLEEASEMDQALIKIKLLELLFSLKKFDSRMLECLLDFKKETRPNITSIMEENFMNPISLNQLAKLAGRSLSSFRRDFQSIYNMPAAQWIRERRLKKGRELLLTTNMKITDICYTLGFESIAHFSRLFKSQFGHSPSEYRVQLISA